MSAVTTRRANCVLGVLCGNLGIGLSYGWWTGKHSRHHAHPNTEGVDPGVMIGPTARIHFDITVGR